MKKINVQVGNGFQSWKVRMFSSETIYAMNWKQYKNVDTNAVVYGTPPFSIQTHEENIKKKGMKVAYKLETVFNRENHECLFLKLFMQ